MRNLSEIIHSTIVVFSFLFSHKDIGCGYSLEMPEQGTSNEYPQHVFCGEIRRKNISNFWLLKVHYPITLNTLQSADMEYADWNT